MEDLAYYAEESGDFEGEAQRMGLQVQEMRVEEDQQFLPGIGQSRAILNFLAGADEGDVSQVIELDDRFIVLQLVEVIPKGYRSFEEVREEIRPRVLLEKKKEVQVARMRRALQQHGFDGLAEALGTTVQTVTQLSYNQTLIPGLGREPRFIGTVFGLQEGTTSGVVEGDNAAFVVQLTKLYEPPPLGEQMREQIRQQLLNQRRQQVLTQWLAALREQADIKDYRRRFEL
nr:peptidylprolyl isomerase [Rhodothermus marinus]